MLISPAEHNQLLKKLGSYSSEPERYGCDFLFINRTGLVGVQRKTCHDLVASLYDNRMARELTAMESLDQGVLLIEGNWEWYKGRSLVVKGYNKPQYYGVMLSIQAQGVWVAETEGIEHTAEWLRQAELWFSKSEHDSLLRRPKPKVPKEIHILQHFPGISLTRAKAIFTYFGRVPLRWDTTPEEMGKVPGIGKVTVDKLWNVLK